jgi:hypothetical protein
MREPHRLVDNGSALAIALLQAHRRQQPSQQAFRRTAITMGLGASLASGAISASAAQSVGVGVTLGGASPAASLGFRGILLKWLAMGAVAGGAAGAALTQVVPRLHHEQAAPSDVHHAFPRAPLPVASTAVIERQVPSSVGTEPRSGRRALSGRQATAVPARAPGSTSSAPATTLSAQVEAIQRARRALATRDAKAALAALESCGSLRSSTLGPEATLIRIDAYEMLGNHAVAARLAEQFLERFPLSPHADRLRRLIERSGIGRP